MSERQAVVELEALARKWAPRLLVEAQMHEQTDGNVLDAIDRVHAEGREMVAMMRELRATSLGIAPWDEWATGWMLATLVQQEMSRLQVMLACDVKSEGGEA